MITFIWHSEKGKKPKRHKTDQVVSGLGRGKRLTTKRHEEISLNDENNLCLIVMVL